jgi:hypothetical protein
MMSQIPQTTALNIIIGVPQVESRLGRRIRQACLEHSQLYENKSRDEDLLRSRSPEAHQTAPDAQNVLSLKE